MQSIYDSNAPKKPTNLSINSDLLSAARKLNINLSATLESALVHQLRAARRDKWLLENKRNLDTCNALADKHGLFADKHRVF